MIPSSLLLSSINYKDLYSSLSHDSLAWLRYHNITQSSFRRLARVKTGDLFCFSLIYQGCYCERENRLILDKLCWRWVVVLLISTNNLHAPHYYFLNYRQIHWFIILSLSSCFFPHRQVLASFTLLVSDSPFMKLSLFQPVHEIPWDI